MYYTGIGSRKTPPEICADMTMLGTVLCDLGYVLRSGAAAGADTAFQLGMQATQRPNAEIYIPWKGFNGGGGLDPSFNHVVGWQDDAAELVSKVHPAWHNCSNGAKLLHIRNVFQVLGLNLRTPSQFVLFWAPIKRDKVVGGTATAVNLATKYTIPCINMIEEDWKQKFFELTNINIQTI